MIADTDIMTIGHHVARHGARITTAMAVIAKIGIDDESAEGKQEDQRKKDSEDDREDLPKEFVIHDSGHLRLSNPQK